MLDAGFAAALLAGLTGSVHCLAMCGGYAVAGGAAGAQPLLPARSLRLERLVMQLGRLGTYVVLGAAWLPTDGYIDPSQLTYALAAGARRGGCRIFTGTRVTGIEVKGGREGLNRRTESGRNTRPI